jgi:hypothetical protein
LHGFLCKGKSEILLGIETFSESLSGNKNYHYQLLVAIDPLQNTRRFFNPTMLSTLS